MQRGKAEYPEEKKKTRLWTQRRGWEMRTIYTQIAHDIKFGMPTRVTCGCQDVQR